MPTLPKITRRKPEVSTANPSEPVSLTAHQSSVFSVLQVDSRNRKERRKAAATKRARMRDPQLNKYQTAIYNAFRGY